MKLRIATFNLENLDEGRGLTTRFNILRPQLERLKADIICFQEVHGQERVDQPRDIITLRRLLEETSYKDFHLASTMTTNNEVYDKRNLVIASRYEVLETNQYRGDYIDFPQYKTITDENEDDEPRKIGWERPILVSKIKVQEGFEVHIFNLHLKSKIPSSIAGQTYRRGNREAWKSIQSWAEGYFISSMKRVGQAIEVRMIIDEVFDQDEQAKVIVCGDFNAEPDEVPVEGLTGSVLATNNPDLRPKVLIPCQNTIPIPARYTYIHFGKQRLFDHILMSQAMLPYYRRAEIHNETLIDEGIFGATDSHYPESDHAPFIVEYELPELGS